ncbi:MAG: hypothetical protein AAB602_03815 [Patescibacteria group bacterium]
MNDLFLPITLPFETVSELGGARSRNFASGEISCVSKGSVIGIPVHQTQIGNLDTRLPMAIMEARMITERAQKILNAAIEEFIETGEPVSSAQLYESHDFGIRPAMIRFELEELAERGFLEHPYRSAGRIPSDKGYEFFAHQIICQPDQKISHEDQAISSLFEKQEWMELLEMLSSKLGILGVVREYENVYKNGLENLIERLELETHDEINAVIKDFVEIDNRLDKMDKLIEETPEFFIGKKNEIIRSRNLAAFGGSYDIHSTNSGQTDGHQVIIFAIGPKRMDYKKTVKIFKNLKRKTSKISH